MAQGSFHPVDRETRPTATLIFSKRRSGRWRLPLTLAAVSAACIGIRAFFVLTSPILIINEDPKAQILIEGKLVRFRGGSQTGVTELFPWKNAYLVEVRTPTGSQRRTIYPWSGDDDSGSISVDRHGATFDLKNEAPLKVR